MWAQGVYEVSLDSGGVSDSDMAVWYCHVPGGRVCYAVASGPELKAEPWRNTDTAGRPGTADRLETGVGWYLGATDWNVGTAAIGTGVGNDWSTGRRMQAESDTGEQVQNRC